jgi:hypothetical protein
MVAKHPSCSSSGSLLGFNEGMQIVCRIVLHFRSYLFACNFDVFSDYGTFFVTSIACNSTISVSNWPDAVVLGPASLSNKGQRVI